MTGPAHSSANRRKDLWIALLFLAFGLGVIVFAVQNQSADRTFRAEAEVMMARVIEKDEEARTNATGNKMVKYEFTEDGVPYTGSDLWGGTEAAFDALELGDEVEIGVVWSDDRVTYESRLMRDGRMGGAWGMVAIGALITAAGAVLTFRAVSVRRG